VIFAFDGNILRHPPQECNYKVIFLSTPSIGLLRVTEHIRRNANYYARVLCTVHCIQYRRGGEGSEMTYNLYIKRYSGWYLTVKPVGDDGTSFRRRRVSRRRSR